MITVHKGQIQYQKRPFGVTSSAMIFQCSMDQVLQGLEGIICFQNEKLETGKGVDNNFKNLKAVFNCLNDNGVKVNDKCKFLLYCFFYRPRSR